MSKEAIVNASPEDGEHGPLKQEMEELQREMRSAQWSQWILDHQKQIMITVAVLVAALIAAALWMEQQRSQQEAAATLYQQAVNASDGKKAALLTSVTKEFASSSYAAMAAMQLVKADRAHAEMHLQAVIDHPKSMPEWKWQARLDLAAIKIEQGDRTAARKLLTDVVGKDYQQLRHYLLAMAADSASEKQQHLQKALDAPSHDNNLKQKIESLLAAHE